MTEQNIFEENKKFSIPEVIPLLPLHNVLLFPKMMIPLEVMGENSIQLIDESMVKDNINKLFFGVGAGLGFDLWKFQIEGRYRWNLNRINSEDYTALKQMGLELSCAFLF